MRDNPPATPNQTRESERLLLACALQDADTARELLTLVEPFMLADPGLSRAWSALRRVLAAATGPVDPDRRRGRRAGRRWRRCTFACRSALAPGRV